MGSLGGYIHGRMTFLGEHSAPACWKDIWEKNHFQGQTSAENDCEDGRITKCLT